MTELEMIDCAIDMTKKSYFLGSKRINEIVEKLNEMKYSILGVQQ